MQKLEYIEFMQLFSILKIQQSSKFQTLSTTCPTHNVLLTSFCKIPN